jgi:protein disulfide-isomerase A6
MGVTGFPTLKIIKPGKKSKTPIIDDYKGPRESKAIVDAVVANMPNHVTKLTDTKLEGWLKENNETSKAILFTEKGTTSALLKAIAVDFLGSVKIGQIKNTEKASLELFGVEKFPTLVLLPGGTSDTVTYDGPMKKAALTLFLSNVAQPNPEFAPEVPKGKKGKSGKGKESKKEKKAKAAAKEEFESASKSHLSEDASSAAASATAETVVEPVVPTESPDPEIPHATPIDVTSVAPPLGVIDDEISFLRACLSDRTSICLLAFVPEDVNSVRDGLNALANIQHKYKKAGHAIFPFYAVSSDIIAVKDLKTRFDAEDSLAVVAINFKRKWMKRYKGEDFTQEALESWVDAVRMGEGEKEPLPGLIQSKDTDQMVENLQPSTAESAPEPTEEPGVAEEVVEAEPLTEEGAEPEPEADPEATPEVEVEVPSTEATSTVTKTIEEVEQTEEAQVKDEL